MVQSPDANISFRSILEEGGAVYPILSQMHELGVLGRFIPEFDALTCLVQHEFYHRYTADVHTLEHAIRELDRIFTEASPSASSTAPPSTKPPIPTCSTSFCFCTISAKHEGIQGHAESGVAPRRPLARTHGGGCRQP
jgi:[protein-PII] uridylyltransferase